MGQWDALGAAAGSGGQFMNAFMAAKQQAMQNRMKEDEVAKEAMRQSMLDKRYETEQATKGSQWEAEMDLKRRALNQKPGSILPPGVKLSPDQVYDPETGQAKAIPGSKLFQAESGRHAKDAQGLSSVNQKTAGTISAIDEFLTTPGALESQFGGGYSGQITKFTNPDARAKLGNITAGIRSAGLDMMRQGGSVGTMTEREWPMVEQLMANISNSTSEEEARFQFEKVKAKLKSIQSEADRLYRGEWSGTPYTQAQGQMPTAPAAPASGKRYQIISAE